jgi:hypothetical protein
MMTNMLVWSERPEPNATGLKDCTYSAGLQGLVFGGFTKFPLGVYTVAEREALERSDDQPNETGASLDDLIVAVKRRYGITWSKSRVALMLELHARSDLAFIIQGSPGNLAAGHTLRRYDPPFTGGHCVTITPTGDGTHVKWYDPLAPMKSGGDVTTWATVTKWIGTYASIIAVRSNVYAPPVPIMYTEAQMKEKVAQIAALSAEVTSLQTRTLAAESRIAAAKAALA